MGVIIFLVLIALVVIILIQRKQIKYFTLISKNLSAMKVIQNMYDLIGADLDSKSKIQKLNQIIVSTYDIKYSSIVLYDGEEYNIAASTVDEEYYNGIKEIVKEGNIKNNMKNNVSKYITTTSDKTLLYKSAIERNIKSCMFIPIYNKNIYLGFVLLEDEVENAFDSISKAEISKLKNNLGIFLENTLSQNVIENYVNIDNLTNVYNNIYLYTNVRKKIQKYENTTFILLHFSNMEEVNSSYSRATGNKLLIRSIDAIKSIISKDVEIVRYSGTKFLIIMYGTSVENAHPITERILDKVQNTAVEKIKDNYINLKMKMIITSIKKQANIEVEIQEMVNNIDKFKENDTIKIL